MLLVAWKRSQLFESIDRYATETFSSDNANSYAAARADIVSLLDNAERLWEAHLVLL